MQWGKFEEAHRPRPQSRAMLAGQTGQTAIDGVDGGLTATQEPGLVRSVIGRWIVPSDEPRERSEAVLQLVTYVVVRIGIHVATLQSYTNNTNNVSIRPAESTW